MNPDFPKPPYDWDRMTDAEKKAFLPYCATRQEIEDNLYAQIFKADPKEQKAFELDMYAYGTAFMKDGKRIDPTDVFLPPPEEEDSSPPNPGRSAT